MNSTYIRIRSFEITWFQKSFYFMLKNSHASVYCTLTYSPQQLWFSFFSLCPSITPLSPWQFYFSGSILQTYLILYTCVKSRNRKWRKMNIICSSNTGWNAKKNFFQIKLVNGSIAGERWKRPKMTSAQTEAFIWGWAMQYVIISVADVLITILCLVSVRYIYINISYSYHTYIDSYIFVYIFRNKPIIS